MIPPEGVAAEGGRETQRNIKEEQTAVDLIGPYEAVRDTLPYQIKSERHKTVKAKAPPHPPTFHSLQTMLAGKEKIEKPCSI